MSRTPLRELLLGAGIAILVFACTTGAPTKRAVEPGPTKYPQLDARVTEIAMLWGSIREKRQNAGWESDPLRFPAGAGGLCPDEEPEVDGCTDTCRLKDDICDNAEAICDLADQLRNTANHAWAVEKCTSANNSCIEARKKCCDCAAKNGHDDPDAAAGGSW